MTHHKFYLKKKLCLLYLVLCFKLKSTDLCLNNVHSIEVCKTFRYIGRKSFHYIIQTFHTPYTLVTIITYLNVYVIHNVKLNFFPFLSILCIMLIILALQNYLKKYFDCDCDFECHCDYECDLNVTVTVTRHGICRKCMDIIGVKMSFLW